MKTRVANLVWVLGTGGIESEVMQIYCNLNHDRIEEDFIIDYDNYNTYDNTIKQYNGKKMPLFAGDEVDGCKFYKIAKAVRLYKLLKANKYDAVYNNVSYPSTLFYNLIAKLAHVPNVIVQSHAVAIVKQTRSQLIRNAIYRAVFCKFADNLIAVSNDAGKWAYGRREFQVIPNGIDVNSFIYSQEKRNQIRSKLKINDKCKLLGTVGRLSKAKNQVFLVELFARLKEEYNDIKLVIVGTGELYEDLRNEAKRLNVANDVVLWGYTNDVAALLSAIDIFAFPSLHEGYGLAVVEAQVSGLPVIASNGVPINTKVTERIEYIELNKEKWLQAFELLLDSNKDYNRMDVNVEQIKTMVDITRITNRVELMMRNRKNESM